MHDAHRGPAGQHAVRIEAQGTSPSDFVAEVGRLYDGRDWTARPDGQPFSYRYTGVGDTMLSLRRSRVDGRVRGTVPRTDDYVLQWLTAGQGVPDVRTDRVPLVVGTPMLLPTDREFVFDFRDFDQRLVHLSRELVHEVAAERFHTGTERDLGLDHLRPLDPSALARWRGSLALIADELRSGTGTLRWQTVTRQAASAFLDLYPPTVSALPDSLFWPRRARIRAAVEFVHARAHEPITVGDIARAADLSVRSVQEGFVRDLDRTPMTYLRDLRLARAREELLAADPTTTTVHVVARRWGFGHMGRFSAAFHEAFGEYPRETIRR